MKKIGIIGGSGLDNPDLFTNPKEIHLDTPWGPPSCSLLEGEISEVPVVLLARHGRDHSIPPTQVNYRANVHAIKSIGCDMLVASTAVGSLREEIRPGDLVVPDQFIDFTRQRKMTYYETFESHKPSHVAMPDPFNQPIRQIMLEELKGLGYAHHDGATIITIEGPRFSTRSESHMFRGMGADIINMSVATEAILANEINLPYAAIAMSTDYDAWREEEETVTWEAVLAVFQQNVDKVLSLFKRIIPRLGKM